MISFVFPPALVCLAYLLGGLMPGYWLVRFRTGGDVRDQGSHGTGATNVGRVLGRRGFWIVLLLDALKGALVVWCVRHFFPEPVWLQWACGFAVIVGHVWPLILAFRGGKGVATLLGVWLVLLPGAFVLCVPIFLLSLLLLRRFTLAGLCGLGLLPTGAAWASNWQKMPALWAGLCLLVVLIAHREHIRHWFSLPES